MCVSKHGWNSEGERNNARSTAYTEVQSQEGGKYSEKSTTVGKLLLVEALRMLGHQITLTTINRVLGQFSQCNIQGTLKKTNLELVVVHLFFTSF